MCDRHCVFISRIGKTTCTASLFGCGMSPPFHSVISNESCISGVRVNSRPTKRLLLLATKTGYQTRAFADAAQQLGLQVVYGTDRCHMLEDPWGDQALPLHFEDPAASAQQIIEFARQHPIHAIVALGDRPTPTAARASEVLGLPFHPAVAADVCRDKYRSREKLRASGLNVPAFVRLPIGTNTPASPRQFSPGVA